MLWGKVGDVGVEEESTQVEKLNTKAKVQGWLGKNPKIFGNIKRRINNQVLSGVNSTKSS